MIEQSWYRVVTVHINHVNDPFLLAPAYYVWCRGAQSLIYHLPLAWTHHRPRCLLFWSILIKKSDKKRQYRHTTELYLNIIYIFNTITFLDTISMHSTFHKAYKNPEFPSPCFKQMQRILALSVLQWCYKRQKHSMLKYTIKDLTWLWCDVTFVGNILNRLSLLFHASFWIVHFPSAQTINFLY